jgi:hypothetical protein
MVAGCNTCVIRFTPIEVFLRFRKSTCALTVKGQVRFLNDVQGFTACGATPQMLVLCNVANGPSAPLSVVCELALAHENKALSLCIPSLLRQR